MIFKGMETETPASPKAAIAPGALLQVMLGVEFLLGGLNKLFVPDYVTRFRDFVSRAPGTQHGLLSQIVQMVVLPHLDVMAQLARFTELTAGTVLLVTAADLARRRFNNSAGRPLDSAVALVTGAAATALGGLSLTIYLLQGGVFPSVNPTLAFGPPIPIELFNVPLALGIGALEFRRFFALRNGVISARRGVDVGSEAKVSPFASSD